MRVCASAPSSCPYVRPFIPPRGGEVPLLGYYYSPSVRLPLPSGLPWGRFHPEPPHFSHLRENASQPFLESVLGGPSAAESTCTRQVAGSLATPRRRFPARPTTQLSLGDHSEDAPRPRPARQLGPGKRRRAPRPPGGSLAGVLSRPPEATGSRSCYGRGACLPSERSRVSRETLRRGPLLIAGGWGRPAGDSS